MSTYKILIEAIHPETGEIYGIGDIVLIYQGRFGHDNIMTINSMFTTTKEVGVNYIYVSDQKYTDKDYETPFPDNPTGTYLDSVKRKITLKEFKKIERAKRLVSQYSN